MSDILILHGWGSNSDNWRAVKKFLEKGGLKVYLPDLPGFGENPVPSKPWSVDDYAAWTEDFCKKNNLSRFFLLGHSFGGGIAVRFAAAHPEKVQGMVLVSAAVVRMKTPKYYLSLVVSKTGNLVLSLPVLSGLKPILRKILYKLVGTRDYQKLDFDKTNVIKETFKKVVSEDLTRYLPAVEARTLVIWGEEDRVTPLRHGYRINAGLPNSRMEIVKEARHGINLEFPDVLAEKILNFIKS